MNVSRLIRTVSHLKASQVVARVRAVIRRVNVGDVADHGVKLAERHGAWVTPIEKPVSAIGMNEFRFLNVNLPVNDSKDWNEPTTPKLLLYNLHYHDTINSRIEPAVDFDSAQFIKRWIDENPPVSGNGWEAYPLSLRIVNWIKFQLNGGELPSFALDSLYLQARALAQQIEYHLMANHLFANAKALFFAGVFFEGDEASSWYQTAITILRRQLDEQFLADGGHFELSPMYQSILTEDILDLENLHRAYPESTLDGLPAIASCAIDWLGLMSHGDGHPSYFNDSTVDVAPLHSDLVRYAERLGIDGASGIDNGIHHLTDSGYVRYQDGEACLVTDVGKIGPDYQPGHGHCDCLSFEFSVGRQRLLVNTGISTYDVGERRLIERMTSAHNTVVVGGEEQSEVWAAFRVGRRANPVEVAIESNSIFAGHDGYRRIGVTHFRRFEFSDKAVLLQDKLVGKSAELPAMAYFHLAPGIKPLIVDQTVSAGRCVIFFDKHAKIDVDEYSYSGGFNRLTSAYRLVVTFSKELNSRIQYENPVRH